MSTKRTPYWKRRTPALDKYMDTVQSWCEQNPDRRGTYAQIAEETGLAEWAVKRGARALHRFAEGGFVPSGPHPDNGYTFGSGWSDDTSRREAWLIGHATARLYTESCSLMREADHEADPAVAVAMRMSAQADRLAVEQRRALAALLASRAEGDAA